MKAKKLKVDSAICSLELTQKKARRIAKQIKKENPQLSNKEAIN